MAQSSLTLPQQRQLLRIMRIARFTAFGIAGLCLLAAVFVAIAHGLFDGASDTSSPTTLRSSELTDRLMSWSLGVSLIGLLLTAVGAWMRRLLQPPCANCSETTQLGAAFCGACGQALPSV